MKWFDRLLGRREPSYSDHTFPIGSVRRNIVRRVTQDECDVCGYDKRQMMREVTWGEIEHRLMHAGLHGPETRKCLQVLGDLELLPFEEPPEGTGYRCLKCGEPSFRAGRSWGRSVGRRLRQIARIAFDHWKDGELLNPITVLRCLPYSSLWRWGMMEKGADPPWGPGIRRDEDAPEEPDPDLTA
jgi:ribosomal protein L37E